MSVSSRIIKNTVFLYVKMGITFFISLYTTRLILSSLGATDFGIFNVVGGAIGLLGFLNSTLANATQRFMSYAEGEGILETKKKIFNISLTLHVLIACVTTALLLGVMYPLFHGILNIVPERMLAAKVVYLSMIFSTFLTIINVPYDAVMNAHENMLYYSIIGVFEALLRLSVAFAVVHTSQDKLVMYGILTMLIPLITLTIMKAYSHRKYEECVIHPVRYWDFGTVKQIASFSGWNFLTAASSLFSAQGLGLVLNKFFGARLNAAQGIANQLNGQLSAFSANMLKALNPVIVKNAGARNIASMNRVTLTGCKFSAILIMLFAVPFMIEMPYILNVWLKRVPEWTTLFCILQLVQTIICQMAGPASTAVYAQGKIKGYAIWKSVMNVMPLFLSCISFRFGGSPVWLYIPMIVIWSIGGDIVIVRYANKMCGLNIIGYLKSVCLPLLCIAGCMILCGIWPSVLMESSPVRLLATFLLTTSGLFAALHFWGLDISEKEILKNLKCRLINRRCTKS